MTKYQIYGRLVKRPDYPPDPFVPLDEPPSEFMTMALLKAETIRHNMELLYGMNAIEIKVEPVEAV